MKRLLPLLLALAVPAGAAELPVPGAAAKPLMTTPREAAPRPATAPVAVALPAGTGRLLQLPGPATMLFAADPRIARVQPASPGSVFLMGVAAGVTTVVATAEDGSPVAQFDVTVQPGAGRPVTPAESIAGAAAAMPAGAPAAPPPASAAAIESLVRRMVHGEVRVAAAGRNGFVLSGSVASPADAQRAEAIAQAAAGEGRPIVNNLSLLSAIQVNLRVRVAEISRQVQRDLGFNWQALASSGGFMVGLRNGVAAGLPGAITGAAAAAAASAASANAIGGGSYGIGYKSGRFDLNTVIDALAADQLITILAEPNLTAQSGEAASFLAGGEFPVPVAASGVSNTITIEFKQFGVSLAFIPTVLAPDRLNLRVRPEVSELSENGAISLPLATGVVRVPALTVRRAETTVELGSGQSFAIAGLLQRGSTMSNSGLAGLADLPVLGTLFRSDRFKRDETELVIVVTPYLVRPVSEPGRLAVPTDGLRLATDLERVLQRRQIARGVAPMPARSRIDAGFILE